ncbi:MAG TPA: hypothetical protein VGQ71_13650 [Terriglobales bacterium]|nr:hypothetical protein [Terriglobales bacterium]
MAVKAIRLGQVWRSDQSGKNFLVTKVYNEALAQYAMLRQADANPASAESVRVKVTQTADGASLPGYTFAQEAHDF